LIAVAKEKIKKCEADVALLRGDGSIDTPEQERYDESPGSMDLPVIRAIYSGDPNTVHKLLAQGLDVNSVILDRAGRDRTALYFATKKGSITIVQLLLDHGAACADFALHEAVIRDRVDIVKLCIAHGANIHTPNPLWDYFAVLKHVKSIEMAKVFIEAGQTQDEINAGLSTFCDHIHEESLEIVEFLLQHGAQFNGPDYFPLVKFLRREHVNVVRLLLEKGADVYEWDKYGGYLCEAVKSGGNEDAVRLLLNYKANVNVLERDGTSALILAAGCSFDGIVSLLLDHGADIENRTKNGVRALHAATRAGDLETVLILLQRGAAPNVQMSDGQTPLHIAAKTGQIAMTVLLLENGADPKLVDSEGMTAQQLASKSCQPGTEGILQKATGDSTAQENSQSLRTAGDDGRSKASSSKGTSESHDHQIPKTRNPRFFKRIFRRHKEEKDSGSGDRSD
jgi:ankyrin repeat protein